MNLKGRFVFISLESREFKGTVYYNASVEGVDKGTIFRVAIEPVVIGKLQKYQTYQGTFELRNSRNGAYLTLVDVESV